VLVRDGRVSGLLDFEFCALDWRAMELAVRHPRCVVAAAVHGLSAGLSVQVRRGAQRSRALRAVPDWLWPARTAHRPGGGRRALPRQPAHPVQRGVLRGSGPRRRGRSAEPHHTGGDLREQVRKQKQRPCNVS